MGSDPLHYSCFLAQHGGGTAADDKPGAGTEPRTLRFSLADDLRIRHLAQRTAPEFF
jgi:hypothetical protein